MLEKLTTQQRTLLAIAFTFVFFMAYQYFIISKYPPKKLDQNTTANQTQNIEQISKPNDAPIQNVQISTPTNTQKTQIIAQVKGEHFNLEIDKLGRIYKYTLEDKKFTNEDGKKVQLIDEKLNPKPLEMRFSDQAINQEAFEVAYIADKNMVEIKDEAQSIVLTQKLTNALVVKTITFYPKGNYDISLSVKAMGDFFISPGTRPNEAVDGYTFHGIIVQDKDGSLNVLDDGDVKETKNFLNTPLVTASDRYYTTLFYNYDNAFNTFVSKGSAETDELFIKAQENMNFHGYIGPKDHKDLTQIDARLVDVIEYGWFTFIAKPVFSLLNYLHSLIGNWGWSIVAMTFLIRLVLFPLTYKGMVSMNKLKELAPKIKQLQVKYKGEPQKLNMHMMDLYKKHGANPMGGCLPILLQIPVFFAIYRVLQNAIELKAAPWILWVHDLSIKDPYYILPIAMGVTMFLHQRITPTNFTDPMQEKIMKFLPLIFTFFFITFPAGLTLYWFTNNVFSIIQQAYVNKLFAKKNEEQKVEDK